MFGDVRVDVEQLMRDELRVFSRFVSESRFKRLSRSIGWNVIVTATK
jgi:hypothetical protein